MVNVTENVYMERDVHERSREEKDWFEIPCKSVSGAFHFLVLH